MSDGGALWFVAALAAAKDPGTPREPHCLVRVNTPLGAPHVACATRELGLRWLDLMGVAGQACVVRGDDLHPEIHFDVARFGVLVFDDDAALDAYLRDADGFDYAGATRRPQVAAASGDPW